MGWYTVDKISSDEKKQMNHAVSELYDGLTIVESHRQVFSESEKRDHSIDFDAVSYHAAKVNSTGEVTALIMLERDSDKQIVYKPYTEHDVPGAAQCPKSIIDKLTPTDHAWANEWRDKCRQHHNFEEASKYRVGFDEFGWPIQPGYKRPVIKALEKLQGDVPGVLGADQRGFTTIWVVADTNNNLYASTHIQYHRDGITEDIDNTKWTRITNAQYSKLSDNLSSISTKTFDITPNNFQPKNLASMSNSSVTPDKEVTVSGFLGTNHKYNFYDKTQKSTLAFTIKPSGGEWTKVRAYNATAEKLKVAIETEGIDKLTITGKIKPVAYETKDGKKVSYDELQVKDFIKHKLIEISGNIGKVEHKETKNNKKFTELLIIDEKVVGEGKPVSNLYNVTIWEDKLKQIPEGVKLEVGSPIAVKGQANILSNKAGTQQYTSVDAWNVDKNLEKLQFQISGKIAAKAEKEVSKSGGAQMGM